MAASLSSVTISKDKGVVNSDEPSDILFLEDLGSGTADSYYFLLAKVLGSKHLNPRAFTNVMKALWSPTRGMEITQLERALFLIKFNSHRDIQSVLKGEP
ncbi:hypothetical protein Tsubulata_044304 [Turnera subulata]|uniref:DUF4283 domain-containing protein n=1 Tax=Turnera subulata TaxID=218843 RepID=A0A9Q0FTM0_9ROSI|nr:hypothetical protein Tsubulata_044304 [Turnera subulata]